MKLAVKTSLNYFSLIGATLVVGSAGLIKFYLHRKRVNRRKLYPKDVVILHQFPTEPILPSISIFCIKLETWLKVNNIEYLNEFSMVEKSYKGKVPWITLNDVDISDSTIAIEYLTKYFGKDLDDELDTVQKAQSRAFFKLAEDSFKWAMYVHRFKYGSLNDLVDSRFLRFALKLLTPKILKSCDAQGTGVNTKEEVYDMGKKDLKAMEDFLDNKKYFFGDKITMLDIQIFQIIAQLPFFDRGEFNSYLREKCPNLVRHFLSIKQEFWPTWKDELTNLQA